MFLTKFLNGADHPYLFGPGGRKMNNKAMAGMTMKSLKHHTALQPLFIIMTGGIIFVAAYCFSAQRRDRESKSKPDWLVKRPT